MNPWGGKPVSLTIDGHPYLANYNPGELTMMRTAREAGATRRDLEAVHLIKALIGGNIIDAQAAA